MKKILLTAVIFFTITPVVSGQTASDKLFINRVPVKNFTKSAPAKTSNGDYLLVNSEKYQIVYLASQEQFLITVFAQDFQNTRLEAENQLIKLLELGRSDTCKINIVITADTKLHPELAGKTYLPSSCKDVSSDINADREVNTIDYALCLKKYGRVGEDLKEDVNADKAVNALDLSMIIASLNTSL